MAKVRILSLAERKVFQAPPIFQGEERNTAFEPSDAIKKMIGTLRLPYRKVGLVLQWGYFKCVGKFFAQEQFHKKDIAFVSKILSIDLSTVEFKNYKGHSLLNDQRQILEMTGFQYFDNHAQASLWLSAEVKRLIEKQVRPKMIVTHLSAFFFQKKIEAPSYQKMSEVILDTLSEVEAERLELLKNNITPQQMQLLDGLVPKISGKKTAPKESDYARAPLIALREFPLSARPGKIKKSIAAFLVIKAYFESTYTAIKPLNLSPNTLKYNAGWVQKSKMTQIAQISNPYKRTLYLLAFITHHYFFRQDLLIDTLLQAVQSTLHRIEKAQREEDKKTKKEREHATQVLSASHHDQSTLISKVCAIVNAKDLSAEEKVEQLKSLVNEEDDVDPEITACIEKLNTQISNTLNEADFYNALSKESLKLQNRLSGILKQVDFNALNSKASLLEAIRHFRETDGEVGQNPPTDFIEEKERRHLMDDKGKIRPSLYKALLLVHTAEAIKSGEINLAHSYRYLSIDEYLIDKKLWRANLKDYLERAQLSAHADAKETLSPLRKTLEEHYQTVNESINTGKNPHVSFNKSDEIILDTPKVEKIETKKISALLKQDNYVSILDIGVPRFSPQNVSCNFSLA